MNKYINKILFLNLIFFLTFPCFCFATDDTTSPIVDSPAAILMHPDTDEVLFEKNAYKKMYPASTTKVMTAILVIESGHSLDEIATVSEGAVSTIPAGYSTASLKPGEQFTLEQLLNVLLIPSANDAANVLAEYISGTVEDFAELMNQKALNLGCIDTHFTNPSGMHNDNHYSTAYDLCCIAKYAMKNETFREFVKKTSCSLPATEQYPYDDRMFENTNILIIPSTSSQHNSYYYPYAIGVKTGFTSPAGNCLIAASAHDNLEFITVILGSSTYQRFTDSINLFDYAYNNYSYKKIISNGDLVTETKINNATRETENLSIVCGQDIFAFVSNSENNALPEISLKSNLVAPIHIGDIVGHVKYTVMGNEYESNLLAGSEVKASTLYIKIIGMVLIISIITLVFILAHSNEKNIKSI